MTLRGRRPPTSRTRPVTEDKFGRFLLYCGEDKSSSVSPRSPRRRLRIDSESEVGTTTNGKLRVEAVEEAGSVTREDVIGDCRAGVLAGVRAMPLLGGYDGDKSDADVVA